MEIITNNDSNPNGEVEGSLHGIMANVLNCDILVSEFKLQSHYLIYFWTNTLGEKYKLPSSQLWVK